MDIYRSFRYVFLLLTRDKHILFTIEDAIEKYPSPSIIAQLAGLMIFLVIRVLTETDIVKTNFSLTF